MNKRELASSVAERTGLSKGEAQKAVQAAIDVLTEVLQAGERVTLMGFGAFFSHDLPPRKTYNLYTQQREQLEARRVVKFKPTFPV